MKGYGYGVWLVPKSKIPSIKHIPHITIMCNMNKEDAIELYKILSEKYKDPIKMYVNKICRILPGSYDNDPLYGSGFDCKYNEFSEIMKICHKFTGDKSFSPHLTYHYSNTKSKVISDSFENDLYSLCDIKPAFIDDIDPTKWSIIEL